MSGPPQSLVQALTGEAGVLSGLEWHESCSSTNALAAQAARAGRAEIHAVLADEQTAGRGRLDRRWLAPPGTSLLLSLLVRPPPGPAGADPGLGRLPLLTGLALVEAVAPVLGDGAVAALKWPNDLLVAERKAAGVLVEVPAPGVVVVGLGLNVDWRGVVRPPELVAGTSLAEHAGGAVDRWRVLTGVATAFARRYAGWQAEPVAFLDDYRRRCTTIGRQVRVDVRQGERITGTAVAVDDDGGLVVRVGGVERRVTVGDVVHLRGA